MAWFFVQVWVLCLVAFLLGAAATWLAFVRPLRQARDTTSAWPEMSTWPAADEPPAAPSPRVEPEPLQPPPGPPTNSALAAVDPQGLPRRQGPGVGVTATGALDRLGVRPTIPAQSDHPADESTDVPDIPAQSGPADGR
ncbi:MAG: hypothetical protein QOF00_487 [Pseudonocardiales bacterium]|nr:hypothetical protein [Pseudonocardiales bacterium]